METDIRGEKYAAGPFKGWEIRGGSAEPLVDISYGIAYSPGTILGVTAEIHLD